MKMIMHLVIPDNQGAELECVSLKERVLERLDQDSSLTFTGLIKQKEAKQVHDRPMSGEAKKSNEWSVEITRKGVDRVKVCQCPNLKTRHNSLSLPLVFALYSRL